MRSRTELALLLTLALCAPVRGERGAPGPGVPPLLSASGPLTASDADAVLDVAGHRSPGLRQQVIERLLADPAHAAGPVVRRLAHGSLAERLTCVEVLARMGAPIQEVDPWTPATVDAALPRLTAWAARGVTAPAPALAGESLDRALADLTGPDETRAAGALERLSALGAALTPRLREVSAQAREDRVARRVSMLR